MTKLRNILGNILGVTIIAIVAVVLIPVILVWLIIASFSYDIIC